MAAPSRIKVHLESFGDRQGKRRNEAAQRGEYVLPRSAPIPGNLVDARNHRAFVQVQQMGEEDLNLLLHNLQTRGYVIVEQGKVTYNLPPKGRTLFTLEKGEG